MRVVVTKEGEWQSSKTGDGSNKHIIFKTIPTDGTPSKEVRLNITDYESFFNGGPSVKSVWEPISKEGNVLDVTLYVNERNVNKFQHPKVVEIKPINQPTNQEEENA